MAGSPEGDILSFNSSVDSQNEKTFPPFDIQCAPTMCEGSGHISKCTGSGEHAAPVGAAGRWRRVGASRGQGCSSWRQQPAFVGEGPASAGNSGQVGSPSRGLQSEDSGMK